MYNNSNKPSVKSIILTLDDKTAPLGRLKKSNNRAFEERLLWLTQSIEQSCLEGEFQSDWSWHN